MNHVPPPLGYAAGTNIIMTISIALTNARITTGEGNMVFKKKGRNGQNSVRAVARKGAGKL